GGDADLHAVHLERLDHYAHIIGLPGLWLAGWVAVAWRAARPREGQPPGAMARADRLFRHPADAEPSHLRRRGRSRRARPAQDFDVSRYGIAFAPPSRSWPRARARGA